MTQTTWFPVAFHFYVRGACKRMQKEEHSQWYKSSGKVAPDVHEMHFWVNCCFNRSHILVIHYLHLKWTLTLVSVGRGVRCCLKNSIFLISQVCFAVRMISPLPLGLGLSMRLYIVRNDAALVFTSATTYWNEKNVPYSQLPCSVWVEMLYSVLVPHHNYSAYHSVASLLHSYKHSFQSTESWTHLAYAFYSLQPSWYKGSCFNADIISSAHMRKKQSGAHGQS